jgi:hypothetical protein
MYYSFGNYFPFGIWNMTQNWDLNFVHLLKKIGLLRESVCSICGNSCTFFVKHQDVKRR